MKVHAHVKRRAEYTQLKQDFVRIILDEAGPGPDFTWTIAEASQAFMELVLKADMWSASKEEMVILIVQSLQRAMRVTAPNRC